MKSINDNMKLINDKMKEFNLFFNEVVTEKDFKRDFDNLSNEEKEELSKSVYINTSNMEIFVNKVSPSKKKEPNK